MVCVVGITRDAISRSAFERCDYKRSDERKTNASLEMSVHYIVLDL